MAGAAVLFQRVRAAAGGVGQGIGRLAASVLAPSADSLITMRRLRWVVFWLVVLIPGGVFVWSVMLSPWVADRKVLDRVTYADERSMGVEVVDSGERYLGMIHYKADPKFDYVEPEDIANATPETLAKIEAYDIRPDHKTIHVLPEETPPYFWKCLVHLEDRMMGTWRNPAGIDFWTAFKIPFNGDGGSTIPMMISRHMRKSLPDSREPLQRKVWRKMKEWEEAPTLWRHLGQTPGRGALKAWAAQHVVLLTNLGGGAADIIPDVYGVQSAGRLLFAKAAADLSPAQQLMLAAAYQLPLVPYREAVGEADDPGVRRAGRQLARWKSVADRAAVCVEPKSRVLPAKDRAMAKAEIDAMRAHPPRIAIDAALLSAAAELARQKPTDGFAVRLEHPYARLRLTLPRPHRRFVADLLTDRFGRNWRDQVRRLQLTLDSPADLRFQKTMGDAWGAFEKTNLTGWLLSPSSADAMGYLAVVADDQGKIVRFHEGGMARTDGAGLAISRYEGGSARYPGAAAGAKVEDLKRACAPGVKQGGGRCPFGERTTPYPRQGREMASIGKILGALALADDGAAPLAATVAAFGKSDNRAVEAVLAGVDPRRMLQLMAAFGITRADADTSLPTAVSRGYMQASPREIHRLVAFALAVARGRFDEPVYMPTLIASYDLFDVGRAKASDRPSPDLVDMPIVPAELLEHAGGPSRAQMTNFVASTLSAPVCKGGTLRALSEWCPQGARKVQLHIAKSGTRANGKGETVDIWIAGGVVLADGRAFSYVVLAGTGQPDRPFHLGNLNAGSAAGIVDAMLEDLTVSPPQSSPNLQESAGAKPAVDPSGNH